MKLLRLIERHRRMADIRRRASVKLPCESSKCCHEETTTRRRTRVVTMSCATETHEKPCPAVRTGEMAKQWPSAEKKRRGRTIRMDNAYWITLYGFLIFSTSVGLATSCEFIIYLYYLMIRHCLLVVVEYAISVLAVKSPQAFGFCTCSWTCSIYQQ